MDEFQDIRPYRDHETRDVLGRLAEGAELAGVITRFRYPRLPAVLQAPARVLVRRQLRKLFADTDTVADFQGLVWRYVDLAVRRTTAGLTVEGFEALDPRQAYLFISNHRDIVLDPALLDYALVNAGRDTVEIAIGDNLLGRPMVADLMRLNRSFIVPRSVEGMKAKLKALTHLSRYIDLTLQEGHSVWIAQREGRAKDGVDRTDPAVIKMLAIAGRKKGLSFGETIRELNIVPVSIAYEYDPCDTLKAAELAARAQGVAYVKASDEDLQSIARGIAQPKGRVHICVGKPLTGDYADAEAVAAELDAQITANYRLFPSNLLALEHIHASPQPIGLAATHQELLAALARRSHEWWSAIESSELQRHAQEFTERLAAVPDALRRHVLEMYANPVLSKAKGRSSDCHQPALA
jgi:hypothetical protein